MSKQAKGYLRNFMLTVPKEIYACTGIEIPGRKIKSTLFAADVPVFARGLTHP